MTNDSWLMGALAAQGAYRGDDPQWPEPPQPGTVFNSPWERGVAIADDYTGRGTPPASATEEPPEMGSLLGMGRAGETIKRAGQGVAKAVDYWVGMPKRVYEGVQPETPGQWSEGDEARKQQLLGAQYEWAPQTAFGTVFDPFGVKRSVGAGVTLGAGAGGGSRIIQPTEGIRAYHSSPHDFERFDLSKIGTGEGAQVYGHGIYAAENPAVSGQGGQYWQQFTKKFEGPEYLAADKLRRSNFDRNAAADLAQRDIDVLTDALKNGSSPPGLVGGHTDPHIVRSITKNMLYDRQAELDLLRSNKPVGPRTYEVGIHAKPEQFLDWDKPLGQQAPDVRDVLHRLGRKPEMAISRVADDMKGGEFYNALEAQNYRIGSGISGGKPEASAALHEAGIPGIRYLDQGSRQHAADIANAETVMRQNAASKRNDYGAWQEELARLRQIPSTSNYVVFDPERISILKKYGLAGAVPTMGALAAADRYAE